MAYQPDNEIKILTIIFWVMRNEGDTGNLEFIGRSSSYLHGKFLSNLPFGKVALQLALTLYFWVFLQYTSFHFSLILIFYAEKRSLLCRWGIQATLNPSNQTTRLVCLEIFWTSSWDPTEYGVGWVSWGLGSLPVLLIIPTWSIVCLMLCETDISQAHESHHPLKPGQQTSQILVVRPLLQLRFMALNSVSIY